MSVLLQVDNLVKKFGGVTAVNEVSFPVLKGEIFSLIGPNGAGKTTMFNLISRIFPVTSGTITLDGKDITQVAPHKIAALGMGRTFQNLAVFKHASVVDNLLVGRHSHMKTSVLGGLIFGPTTRAAERANRRRVEDIIDFLEIQHVRDVPVGALAYGLQKRVELGRALATEPKLLLLDEMVSGMNAEETEDIARFILDLKEELEITVMMIEHDMGIVTDISDHIGVMNFGERIAYGTPDEIRADPHVIEAYLGHKLDEEVGAG
ncbi:MAG: ABC transporter ATP-binding protein [Rhodobacteraceae bacterium]|nr:ABC transporter ATP-binding protein [Paracoccaceae bacterium]